MNYTDTSMDDVIEIDKKFQEFFLKAKSIIRAFPISKYSQKWEEKEYVLLK